MAGITHLEEDVERDAHERSQLSRVSSPHGLLAFVLGRGGPPSASMLEYARLCADLGPLCWAKVVHVVEHDGQGCGRE